MEGSNRQTRIVVTGIGAISAAGRNTRELGEALVNPRPLFFPPQRFSLGFDIVVAEIPGTWFEKPAHSEFDTMSGRLALTAARECLDDAVDKGGPPPDGLIIGSSAAGQGSNENFLFSLLGAGEVPAFNFHRQGVVATCTRLVARELDIRGATMTLPSACTSSAQAIALGAMWIEQKLCRRVLVGGCDDLCATTMSGFHTLLLTGSEPCCPFGQKRPGMTLGEGAAFLLLEELTEVISDGRSYYGELSGYGLSADAYHITAPSEGGKGAALAMKKALKKASCRPEDVHWINAHGTGTDLNDRAEAEAISSIFPRAVPVSSLKGLFGHTLGAAGALEAVVSVLVMQMCRIPQNFRNEVPGDDCAINLVPPAGMALPPNTTIVSNSFGFGGSNCSLIFQSNHPHD